ncbi:MAG: dephospho-CoA kinase [Bdellovibrionales bacterium]|nr:dephospho-CoA kinase [Bdellovibrionales bacterium]
MTSAEGVMTSSAQGNQVLDPHWQQRVVALTGGVGSGKSAAAAAFRALGAYCVSADHLVHELQAPGAPGFQAIVAHFGSGVVTPSGALDRRKLGELVFRDQTARKELEAIVHPLVRDRAAAARVLAVRLPDPNAIASPELHGPSFLLPRGPSAHSSARATRPHRLATRSTGRPRAPRAATASPRSSARAGAPPASPPRAAGVAPPACRDSSPRRRRARPRSRTRAPWPGSPRSPRCPP